MLSRRREARYEVNFRKEIGTATTRLIMLLNDPVSNVRSSTVSALTKLADHGEFVAVCYVDVTNTSFKSSFMRGL
jgi:hypothetical protein